MPFAAAAAATLYTRSHTSAIGPLSIKQHTLLAPALPTLLGFSLSLFPVAHATSKAKRMKERKVFEASPIDLYTHTCVYIYIRVYVIINHTIVVLYIIAPPRDESIRPFREKIRRGRKWKISLAIRSNCPRVHDLHATSIERY